MKTNLLRLKELLTYCPQTGEVRVRKSNRLLQPDETGIVCVFDNKGTPKLRKYKLDKLAYFLAYGVFPSDKHKVLHKNLEEADLRAINLSLVTRGVFIKIKEAARNLDSGIRIVPHSTDQHCYVVHWFDNGPEKSKVFQDVIGAKKFKIKLQLKYSKFLTKYCIFD